jgi:hypothetical protein
MGCCVSSHPTAHPLRPHQKEQNFADETRTPPQQAEGSHLRAGEQVRGKALEAIVEQEEPLNLSGKPGWKEKEFVSYPEDEPQPLDNSPIHIIYSSDHDLKQPTYSSIKKNLFKERPLENSVIHEVSQENADSFIHSQQGSGQAIKRLPSEDRIVEEPVQEEQIHVSTENNLEILGEEQFP